MRGVAELVGGRALLSVLLAPVIRGIAARFLPVTLNGPNYAESVERFDSKAAG